MEWPGTYHSEQISQRKKDQYRMNTRMYIWDINKYIVWMTNFQWQWKQRICEIILRGIHINLRGKKTRHDDKAFGEKMHSIWRRRWCYRVTKCYIWNLISSITVKKCKDVNININVNKNYPLIWNWWMEREWGMVKGTENWWRNGCWNNVCLKPNHK